MLIYLSGVLSLLAGLAIVIAHNRWSGGWPVIITVLGWLMVIGGVIRIVVPQVVQTVAGDRLLPGVPPSSSLQFFASPLAAF